MTEASTVGHRAAVLGRPVAHSLSPVIHNAGYQAAGLDGWIYTRHDCGEEELAGFVAGLGPEWAGLSLTMPLKEVALTVADSVSDLAVALGAANTLVLKPDGIRAENTDAPGMVAALERVGVTTVEHVAVLGAGGTARAAVGAAQALSARQVTVYARRPEAIAELATVAQRLGMPLTGAEWERVPEAVDADLVISTVPRGVGDVWADQPLRWRTDQTFFDVLYDPWPTPLAEAAARAGCRVVGGLELLLAQAVGQFELFTGVTAPVAAMEAALRAAVSGAGDDTKRSKVATPQ